MFVVQPVITVQDAGGNTVTSSTAAVTLAVTGATLTCTVNPKSAVAGVATLAGCALSPVGSYPLSATAASLTGALSTAFSVVAVPANLDWTGYSSTCTGGSSGAAFALVYHLCLSATFTASVTLVNAGGAAVVNLGPAITVTLTGQHGTSSPLTLTIPHGSSVSTGTTKFTAALIAIFQPSDQVTASATVVTTALTATATLNVL